ncbi:hypothetical protein ACFVXG_38245 [Kitasatospora sp. NPDC058162]|uniref:hypothetical protein n=1 Tax=Kitasatospora sp. NPDC058162 TaxID=3346362 RepID=UPI0036D91805
MSSDDAIREGGDLSSPGPALGSVQGRVSGPVVESAARTVGNVTHITHLGEAPSVTRSGPNRALPAASAVPRQRLESIDATLVVPAKKTAWVPQQHQLLSETAGRIALDSYSWMQAAHWVHGAGLYVPKDGPKFGETTIKLAEVLSKLTPCRPSIPYLMRELKCSRRTVQYHRDILQATGLLAWRSVGTRLPMAPGQKRVTCLASEYERLIPVSYDRALGIRTAGEGVERRMTGISEEGRPVIAELGKKAAKRLRRPRRTVRHGRAGRCVSTPRCTPMEGGTTDCVSSSSVGDSKTTGGARDTKSITRKKRSTRQTRAGERRRTVLGQVVTAAMLTAGDRLARVAYRRVPWVRNASHDQLRWVLNDLAARDWSDDQVMAWLGSIAGQYGCVGVLWRPERPHSLIAHALREDVVQVERERELVALAADRVDEASVAAVRELTSEFEFLADLFSEAAAVATVPASRQERREAQYLPAAAAARMEADVDLAIDEFGIDMVARYTALAANPNIQLGVTR